MKLNFKTFTTLCILLLIPVFSFAESEQITLDPVISSNIDRCIPIPKNLPPIEITSIKHQGVDESVGIIKTKGVAEKVYVANDIKQVISDSVRNTLKKCGYRIQPGDKSLKVSIVIKDFFTKSENEGVTGKDTAVLNLVLNIKNPEYNVDSPVDFHMESSVKTVPFMKKKRFSKLLKSTLTEVMNDIAMSEKLGQMLKATAED